MRIKKHLLLASNELLIKKRLIAYAKKHNSQYHEFNKILLGHDSGNYHNLALTTDIFFSSTHFPACMTYHQIGYKSVLASVSDLIAVGSVPKAILVALMIPYNFSDVSIRQIFNGITIACNKLKIGIIGGDTKKSKELGIVITALGSLKSKMVLRNNAKPGDYIYITGPVARSAIGLFSLLRRKRSFSFLRTQKKQFVDECIKNFLAPPVDFRWAEIISKFASSSCDISDGFFFSLRLLSNKKEIVIDNLLLPDELNNISDNDLVKLLEMGEDYVCIFTAPQKLHPALISECQRKGLHINRIGYIEKNNGNIILYHNNKKIIINSPKGYDSFYGLS